MHSVRNYCSAALLMATSSNLCAQTSLPRSDSRRLMVGAHLVGNKMASNNLTAKNEIALGVMIGYGITRWLMVFSAVDLGTAYVNAQPISEPDPDYVAGAPLRPRPAFQPFYSGDYLFRHFDVGARLSLSSAARPWVPFVSIALSERYGKTGASDTQASGRQTLRGQATTVGAGLQYFIDPRFAFEGAVQFSSGKFNKSRANGETITYDNVETNRTTRFTGGLRFYPHIGR